MGKLVEVDAEYLAALQKDSAFMECLDACGVVDWEGYEEAYEMYLEECE